MMMKIKKKIKIIKDDFFYNKNHKNKNNIEGKNEN